MSTNLDKLATLVPMEEIEQPAQKQIYDFLEFDFCKRLAVMPDVHMGYTLCIGGVALLEGVISPAAVGMDIGCGMCFTAVPSILAGALDDVRRRDIYEAIRRVIPCGMGGFHEAPQCPVDFKSASGDKHLTKAVNDRMAYQIGTLGGGNHFIEIGKTPQATLSVTIHSGSRNAGYQVASFYSKRARNEQKDLPNGFLHLNSDLGQAYLADMLACQQYALDNRMMMMRRVLRVLGVKDGDSGKGGLVNENHNHAIVLDNGDVLHRKGATPADKDQIGIIPANMRDGTYVTVGLGNEEYLSSASHGAGRRMSRKDALKIGTLETFEQQMEGIVATVNERTMDERPEAYKDIQYVMNAQEGKVIKTLYHCPPIIVVKGDKKQRR